MAVSGGNKSATALEYQTLFPELRSGAESWFEDCGVEYLARRLAEQHFHGWSRRGRDPVAGVTCREIRPLRPVWNHRAIFHSLLRVVRGISRPS
jgi:hypothetical protein